MDVGTLANSYFPDLVYQKLLESGVTITDVHVYLPEHVASMLSSLEQVTPSKKGPSKAMRSHNRTDDGVLEKYTACNRQYVTGRKRVQDE